MAFERLQMRLQLNAIKASVRNWQNVNNRVHNLTWKVVIHVIEKTMNPKGSKPLIHSLYLFVAKLMESRLHVSSIFCLPLLLCLLPQQKRTKILQCAVKLLALRGNSLLHTGINLIFHVVKFTSDCLKIGFFPGFDLFESLLCVIGELLQCMF